MKINTSQSTHKQRDSLLRNDVFLLIMSLYKIRDRQVPTLKLKSPQRITLSMCCSYQLWESQFKYGVFSKVWTGMDLPNFPMKINVRQRHLKCFRLVKKREILNTSGNVFTWNHEPWNRDQGFYINKQTYFKYYNCLKLYCYFQNENIHPSITASSSFLLIFRQLFLFKSKNLQNQNLSLSSMEQCVNTPCTDLHRDMLGCRWPPLMPLVFITHSVGALVTLTLILSLFR